MIDQRQVVGTLLERPSATRVAKTRQGSPRRQIPRTLPSLRERTRAENRGRYGGSPMHNLALEFRCECARPDCRVRLPLEVERHRRSGDRFIVGLAHGDADIVVGVADNFLVVEENRSDHGHTDSAAERFAAYADADAHGARRTFRGQANSAQPAL